MSSQIKIFSLGLIFLIFDVSPSTHTLFRCEFLLLGVFLAAFTLGFLQSLTYAVFFGLAKDLFLFHRFPCETVVFVAVVALIHYSFKYFRKVDVVFSTVAVSILLVFYVGTESMLAGSISVPFSIQFIVQSMLVYAVMSLVFKRWIQN